MTYASYYKWLIRTGADRDTNMKQDVVLNRGDNGLFDLQVADQDFDSVEGFETAITISIFTDSRAPSSSVPTPERRRGWIGDILTADVGRSLGSILWTYYQSRLTQSIINEIQIAAQDSLAWLIEDGMARDVSVTVENNTKRGIVVFIDILTPIGESKRYSIKWRSTSGNNF